MTASRIALCLCTLAVVYGGSCAPVVQTSLSFSNSLLLTRTLRARVQRLLQRYNEEQFGDRHFEERRLILNTLPSSTINYKSWLQMQDTERLNLALRNLNTFWTHLETQRQGLEVERGGERPRQGQHRNRRCCPQLSLAQSILGVQLDLRDLLKQISFQLLSMNVSPEGTTSSFTQTPAPTSTFSSPTPRIPVGHTLQSPDSTTSPTSPAPTSSPISGMSVPSSSHSALGMMLTSTPWDTEVLNGRQTMSVRTDGTSSTVNLSRESKLPLGTITTSGVSEPSRWVSRLEGYVILRDLGRYLSRLARDYTLLKAKY